MATAHTKRMRARMKTNGWTYQSSHPHLGRKRDMVTRESKPAMQGGMPDAKPLVAHKRRNPSRDPKTGGRMLPALNEVPRRKRVIHFWNKGSK